MATNNQSQALRGVSLASIIFGILGGGFFWWVPLGIVFSLTGLIFGLVDSFSARRRSLDYRLSIVGLVISVATLALGIVIAALGLQTVTFGWPG